MCRWVEWGLQRGGGRRGAVVMCVHQTVYVWKLKENGRRKGRCSARGGVREMGFGEVRPGEIGGVKWRGLGFGAGVCDRRRAWARGEGAGRGAKGAGHRGWRLAGLMRTLLTGWPAVPHLLLPASKGFPHHFLTTEPPAKSLLGSLSSLVYGDFPPTCHSTQQL